jgi:hypothetical protein
VGPLGRLLWTHGSHDLNWGGDDDHIEYDHPFMGNTNNSFSVPAGAAAVVNQISQRRMVTVRLDYKLGGPVVLVTDLSSLS